VSRRINQIQTIRISIFRFVVQANAFRFDGDAALALQVHGVEELFVHFALRQRAGHFQEAVRQRGFAVVDVRDDAEIPYELRIHFLLLPVFSAADFLCFRQEFESPAGVIPGGPAAFERVSHAA
jgi:hypothetical protein